MAYNHWFVDTTLDEASADGITRDYGAFSDTGAVPSFRKPSLFGFKQTFPEWICRTLYRPEFIYRTSIIPENTIHRDGFCKTDGQPSPDINQSSKFTQKIPESKAS
jgi:hypothetical protein